ncbi:MAG: ChaN family lipoprotein [Flavobacteriales bacterium]
MRKLLLFTLLNFYLFIDIFGQDRAFQIYNDVGKKVSYRIMSQNCGKADVVLFGENHNDPISHWLQLELTKSLFDKHGENLMLGSEMLESDDQLKLDEYLLGFIREKDFEKEAKIWTNHKTDYRPLVSFAKDNNLHFVATNIPRRFANMVYRFGMDTLNYLSEASKQFIAPLPIDYDTSLYCYKEISVMAEGHGGENLPKSQVIKDATMAHFIYLNMKKETRFLHYNGSYHSKYHESIMWHLLQLNPDLDILTIEVAEQIDISKFDEELIGNADFYIVVDEDMCKTH